MDLSEPIPRPGPHAGQADRGRIGRPPGDKRITLRKILALEAERGYNDDAVGGGIDLFLDKWRDSLASDIAMPPLRGGRYGALVERERRDWVAAVMRLNADSGTIDALHTGHHDRPDGSADPGAPGPVPEKRGRRTPRASERGKEAPPVPISLDMPLTDTRIATKPTLAKLARLDVHTLRDLLFLFPHRHIDYSTITPIAELEVDHDITVVAQVRRAEVARIGPGPGATRATFTDSTGLLTATWFRQPYLAKRFQPGTWVALSGRVQEFRGRAQMHNPEYEVLSAGRGVEELVHAGNVLPFYPSTEGLLQRTLRNAASKALAIGLPLLVEHLPANIRERHNLPALAPAVRDMHLPPDPDAREQARRRLAFDELFLMQLAVLRRRIEWRGRHSGIAIRPPVGALEKFLGSLEFTLTDDQSHVLRTVQEEMAQDVPMGRLLQGEVGSGKTIVAVAALLAAALTGHQGALMVPTEVLAEQHFLSVSGQLGASPIPGAPSSVRQAVLPGFDDRPVRVGLLIGSLTGRVKTRMHEMISAGEVDLIIGTHALFQESVDMPRLALAVVDEQHRFGVEQRAALMKREPRPHLLGMSATPIPRSLALTLYGDLDLSTLKTLPAGRRPIKTRWMRTAETRREAYQLVRAQVDSGRQAFVVCPLIDESEEVFARAAVVEHARLSAGELSGLRVGLLHGRMKLDEKQDVMSAFRAGDLDVLVATPVIEVGIDIPNATVMLIESADRFGLSQLHQLRGRVGRGPHPSYCLLLSDRPSAEARARMSIVERTSDGFELAEEDLRLRGPGDYIGRRQSGFAELKVASFTDSDLLAAARDEATRLLERDPAFASPAHAALGREVDRATQGHPVEIS